MRGHGVKRKETEQLPEHLNETWTISYNLRERESSDTHRSIEMSWENRTPAEVMDNLNAFLVATRMPLKVVPAK